MINIAYCRDITDASFSSLCKCSRLKIIEARGCPLITSSGLAAAVAGCKLLKRLDLKKCCKIDDAGMIPLAHFSKNLRQVTITLFSLLIREEQVGPNVTYLVSWQINLSYSSVTDLGLLSLASLSCLQHLTVLHTNRLTPSGVGVALLANNSLTKVKLHALFQALLPERLLKHLQARGCTFEWRQKTFQVLVNAF